MLHHQLPWYVGGPVLGLCVITLRLLLNGRLGVTSCYTSVIESVRRRSLVFALIAGGPDFHGYGWLTDTFHDSGQTVIAVLLVVAGVLIGFGSKTAGGCTSGNGLSGTSMLSPASVVATATFFATAIAVSFAIEAVI